MSTDTANNFWIECERLNGNVKVRVTARLDGRAVHMHKFDLGSATQREEFARALKDKVPQLDENQIKDELLKAADAARHDDDGDDRDDPDDQDVRDDPAEAILRSMPQDVRDDARAMLDNPYLIKLIMQDAAALGVAGEQDLTATIYLTATSRKLGKPLAAIVQGPSSSGKSFVVEKVSGLIPPEDTIYATQMTPQALFHMKPGSLRHKYVIGGERSRLQNDDVGAEATRALREMLSAGRLTKLMPMKGEGGVIETRLIEQDGPIAYVETTTLTRIFAEDLNRHLLLNTDERPEQTKKIINKLAAGYGSNSAAAAADTERIILRHHALQRTLKALPVVIPYAARVGERMPAERVEVRRAFPQLMSMVEAVALLHQYQRERDTNGQIVAAEMDYRLAYKLLATPMARVLGDVISDPARRFFERLTKWAHGEFTSAQAKREEKGSRSSVYGWLAELHDAGLVELVVPAKGKSPATWKVTNSQADDAGCSGLPSPEEVFR
jgi:hypothetical protein